MKLMYAPQSPFARKVRIASLELDLGDRIQLRYAEAVPGKDAPTSPKQANPLGKIPALILDRGEVLVDSNVICEYLDWLDGRSRLLPPASYLRCRLLSDVAIANGVCEALISIRYETWLRPPDKRWEGWIHGQWEKVWSVLDAYELQAPSIGQGTLNLFQITLGCGIGYLDFRFPETRWRRRCPNLASWFDKLAERPSFSRTMPRDPNASDQSSLAK
ncbi:glutathione S-transferase [Bradyrhizobium sp. USDA 4461]